MGKYQYLIVSRKGNGRWEDSLPNNRYRTLDEANKMCQYHTFHHSKYEFKVVKMKNWKNSSVSPISFVIGGK